MTTTSPAAESGSTYVLGHADAEVQRLLLQGRLYDDYTEHAFRLAGLRPGMRVLDIGSGPGDVSFVAARLVGPTGTRSGGGRRTRDDRTGPHPSRRTRLVCGAFRARRHRRDHLGRTGRRGGGSPDPDAPARPGRHAAAPQFLRAPGRRDRVLRERHHRDAQYPGAATVRPGNGGDRARVRGDGAQCAVWHHPAHGFSDAGLGAPRLTLGTPIGTAADSDILAYAAEVWRLVSPVAQQLGLEIDQLADIDSFVPRFREEALAVNALITMPPMITAWTRVRQ